jgi:phospholipid N-methyltransferase
LGIFLLLTSAASLHKYYVSVSEVMFSKQDQAIQIITRIFIDDIEEILQLRYDEAIVVDEDDETSSTDFYLKKYFNKKLMISINGENKSLNFIGKEYEDDMVICYIEVENIKEVRSIQIVNTLLFDLVSEQQNMVHFDINDTKKSLVLRSGNDKGMLNF